MSDLLGLARRAAATVLTGEYASVGEQLAARVDAVDPGIRAHLEAGRLNEALEIVGALWFFWEETGRVDEGRGLAAVALEAAAAGGVDVDRAIQARAMLTAAELAFRQGDQAEAELWNTRTIAAASAAGDSSTAAAAEVGMARTAFRVGDAERIEAWSRRALDRAPDDLAIRRGAYHMLAWAAHTRDDRQAAIDWFERSLGVRRTMGDPFGVSVELGNLGDMATEAGDFAAAARYLSESLAIAAELRNMYLLPALIGSAGALAIRAGFFERGCGLVGASRAIYGSVKLEPDPSTASMLDEAVRLATGAIAPDAARAAIERGERMTLDDAIGEASDLAAVIASAHVSDPSDARTSRLE